jgi:hypothetical protein
MRTRTKLAAALFTAAVALLAWQAAAGVQSRDQQTCLNAMGKDVSKVARAQADTSARCIKSAGRARLGGQTAQQCVEADNGGKVARAAGKTLADEAARCSDPPDFGYTGALASNQAAVEEDVSLLADVFGTPLEDAISSAADAGCQQKVAKAYGKIQQAELRAFLTCAKAGLKNGGIDSAATLETCFTAISGDFRRKIAKSRTKLRKILASSKCLGASPPLDLAAVFAGNCTGEVGDDTALTQCIDAQVQCRVCRLINLAGDLTRDCDDFDDGVINSSCDSTLPTCSDGKQNQGETDTDCGGANCPGCADGSTCAAGSDCQSGVCAGNVCQVPTCSDGVANGDESDVDCGGSCAACPDGSDCNDAFDCQSLVCPAGICLAPTCADLIQNQDETDVDCGGSCSACADGADCVLASDCQSLVCTGNVCQAPTCSDGIINGDESDTDCGGTSCTGCPNGGACNAGSDCQNGVCSGGICLAPTCSDSVANGNETDVDCGGGTCSACALGQGCNAGTDCTTTLCQGGVCSCGSQAFTFSITSNTGGAFDSAEWPGGTAMQNGLPGCSVTIDQPSGNIDLAGTLGDDFDVASFTGYSSCYGTGGEDGDGCQPDTCPPLGIAYCQDRRPSCSAALNGSGSARFFVQCVP